ncbi:DUF6346 domain-containing protein [Lentzea sp. NPDC051213]|uniref:DUF6346 domain-containing protein n=1 Tax=Lentzea sp. NPDC051213 TaxID=3364126 RepID=UPI0037A95A02
MHVLRRVLVALIIPFLGYLLGATIFNHFWDRIEPGDLQKATLVAVARSCERHGPVAWRGFGYYYECEAAIRVRSGGATSTSTVTGWLAPEDVGKEYGVHTTRRGRSLEPDVRSQVFLGWLCTFVFAVVFIIAWAGIARLVWPDRGRRKRRVPIRYEPPAS